MNIDIVHQFDSQSKVFNILQDRLSMHSVASILIEDTDSILTYIKGNRNPNVIILTCGARETIFFVRAMQKFYESRGITKRPFIISMLVGLTLDRAFWSTLMQRSIADVVLVNNRHQLKKILSLRSDSINLDNKFIATLPVIFDKYKHVKQRDKSIKCVLFIVQNDIPKTKKDRLYVVERLLEYADKYSARTIIIKPRIHIDEKAAHAQKYPYEKLFFEKCRDNIPQNIIFSYEPITELIPFCDLAISFSSSAILEVLLSGKLAAVIGDIGISEGTGVSYFTQSNLIVSFDDILNDKIPYVSAEWLDKEIDAPDIETILNSLHYEICYANNGLMPFNDTAAAFIDKYQSYTCPNIYVKNENIKNIFGRKKRKFSIFHLFLKKIKNL